MYDIYRSRFCETWNYTKTQIENISNYIKVLKVKKNENLLRIKIISSVEGMYNT